MSKMLSKMNLISVVQQLPKEDIETIQGYIEMIEEENQELKLELSGYRQAILNNKEMLGLKEQNDKLKKKYENAVADYVHKDTLTATDYVELNKDNELLMSYNQALLKENQELKKQVEERTKMYQNAYDYSQKMEGKTIILEIQQQEFIKYLEDEIKTLEKDILETIDDMDIYMKQVKSLIIEEILQKYKEIIGDDK